MDSPLMNRFTERYEESVLTGQALSHRLLLERLLLSTFYREEMADKRAIRQICPIAPFCIREVVIFWNRLIRMRFSFSIPAVSREAPPEVAG
jgi:hypothetical protein